MADFLTALAADPKKQATLVGNKGYSEKIGVLTNPHNDTTLLKSALEQLDFTVTVVTETSQSDLYRAINGHVRRVREAGDGAISFFYYSGHGALNPSTGVNYLIPVDVKDAEDDEFWDRSVRLTEIKDKLEKDAGQANHFVVFDACRNNLKLKSKDKKSIVQSKGFTPVREVNRMLIAYATAEGELASDLGDSAGPYARALAEEIVKPGVEAVQMFRYVQLRVRARISQDPWLGFNGLDEVFFAGRSADAGPSLAAGRHHLRLNNLSSAKEHFDALAAKGDIEAMRELAGMAETSGDTGAMLEWTKKAADAGHRPSQVALAWFAVARNELGDLPKAWESRLTRDEARRMATDLYKAGERDAALILQAAIENDDDKKPIQIAPELQAQVALNHPAAKTSLARLTLQRHWDADTQKPADKPAIVRGVQLYEQAARSGHPVALHWWADNDDETAVRHRKTADRSTAISPDDLQKLVMAAIAAQPADERRAERQLTSVLASNGVALSRESHGDLARIAIKHALAMKPAPDLALAARLADEDIVLREDIHKKARRGRWDEVLKARRLKAIVLAAMNKYSDAIELLASTEDSGDIAEMVRIGELAGWPADVQTRVLDGFRKACGDMSFGDSAATMTECETGAHALMAAKRSGALAMLHKATRDWLEPKSGTPPSDDAHKGRALLLLAKTTDIEASLLRTGETTVALFTTAARLGAKEAADWLRANRHPVPEVLAALRISEDAVIEVPNGGWKLTAIRDNNVVRSCRAQSELAILTKALVKDRKANAVLLHETATPGVGQVAFDMGAPGIDAASVRLFVGRDEFFAPVTVANTRVIVSGDQVPLIVRLANGAMVRLEYRIGTRNAVDVFTLDGFAIVYRTMLDACPGMTSALAIAAAAAPKPPTPAPPGKTAPPPAATKPATPAPSVVTGTPPPGPKPATTIPVAAGTMAKQSNMYFKGDGYRKQAGSTYEQCATLCLADQGCAAIEFQRANLTCQLYRVPEVPQKAMGTDVAIKAK